MNITNYNNISLYVMGEGGRYNITTSTTTLHQYLIDLNTNIMVTSIILLLGIIAFSIMDINTETKRNINLLLISFFITINFINLSMQSGNIYYMIPLLFTPMIFIYSLMNILNRKKDG